MSMVDVMLSTGQQIIGTLLAQAVAAMIAKEAHKGIIGLATAAIGLGAIMGLWSKYKSQATEKAVRMKDGGIVPSGYPNDSYPALLSSGEKVIPPKKLGKDAVNITVEVKGIQRGEDIYYIGKEVERKYENSY